MAYALTVAFSPKFSSPIAFTCMVCQIFPCQIFPMYGTVLKHYRCMVGPSDAIILAMYHNTKKLLYNNCNSFDTLLIKYSVGFRN